jgi:hypothetical protein
MVLQRTIARQIPVAPNVRLRTVYFRRVVFLEAERHVRVDSLEAHMEGARRNRIRDDIARRLRRACSHLGDDDFGRLVDEMVDRQIKGERRVTRDFLLE